MAQIITFILFGGFGLVMLYVGLTQAQQQRRLLRNAQPIQATITHSEVRSHTSSDTDRRTTGVGSNTSTTTHRPDIRFRYSFAGTDYESDLLRPTAIVRSYGSHAAAAAELVPYPLRAVVSAHIDPTSPAKAFLLAESSNAPLVFILIGFALPPLAWFVGSLI